MAGAAAGADPPAGGPAFRVLDLFSGFAGLSRRSPALDGSIPLRVAQACVPHLEGNAYGFQLSLNQGFRVRRSAFGLRPEAPKEARDFDKIAEAARPILKARGWLSEAASSELGRPWLRTAGRRRLRIFTGLLVQPAQGTGLRLSESANRRNVRVMVTESLFGPSRFFEPLFLDLVLEPSGPSEFWLGGELATLAPVAPALPGEECGLAGARDLASAHWEFYDRDYFESKKAAPTGKYRKMLTSHGPTTEKKGARLARFGPETLVRSNLFLPGGETVTSWVFRNPVPFRALFDGHNLRVEPEPKRLEHFAREIDREFATAMGESWGRDHLGWLWYLTKYFTPHPPGEPHFFVKAWGFLETPEGWRTLVDGVHGDGYDILRGVIDTARFHALPAVFKVHAPGKEIRVAAGVPLMRLLPFPEELQLAGFQKVDLL